MYVYVVHIIVHIVHASHEVLSHWEEVGVMQNKGSINTVLITLPYSSVNKLGKLHTLYWRVPCMHLVKWEGKQGELDNTFQPSPYHHTQVQPSPYHHKSMSNQVHIITSPSPTKSI